MRVGLSVLLTFFAISFASAQEFCRIPKSWKWISDEQVVFSYDRTYTDSAAFLVNARTGARKDGVKAPDRYVSFPLKPEGAVNLTYSPDSTMLAFTRENDLYVVNIEDGKETRLTHDGSDVILNGYASWVYYEEIFGRATRYKAFWWAPDSKSIAYYRFDNSKVPMFPIYSAFADPSGASSQSQSPKVTDLGLGGSLSETRYPKAGQTNPEVRIAVTDLKGNTVWADFDYDEDQYFGPPFWSPDSREFFVPRMPRLQNTLDLYAVDPSDGSKRHVYDETYPTWLSWIYSAVFTDEGLYMVREFETGWQQIYFLSYDGRTFRRLTDGTNWAVDIVRVDRKNDEVYFTAKRDATVRQALYKVNSKGVVTALTDPAYHVTGISFSPDGKYFAASYSNITTPTRVAIFQTSGGGITSEGHKEDIARWNTIGPVMQKLRPGFYGLKGKVIADMAGPDFNPAVYALGSLIHITTKDGFTLPGIIVYPKDFDSSRKYPVHVDIYGGPGTPMVRDRWITPNESNQWYAENGIIQITVDPRAAGHNGRKGLDMVYRRLTVNEISDFCEWADYLKSLPYVDGDKIGVEGFSFGGTMTCMLLMQAPDSFHYGIAGGGVYDWALYDSHYTERYMDTPQNNPEGYSVSRVLDYVHMYPAACSDGFCDRVEPVMLKITHGTGDDNVHHQNTLLLLDRLHREGKKFDFMIYPDGMHGYRGYQEKHFEQSNREFWKRYLLSGSCAREREDICAGE
ncbi:MAG: S9 family peptidase [Bacteroidales bacterium]|nr:S9 family peptidase [Bacteroidales bacterium]